MSSPHFIRNVPRSVSKADGFKLVGGILGEPLCANWRLAESAALSSDPSVGVYALMFNDFALMIPGEPVSCDLTSPRNVNGVFDHLADLLDVGLSMKCDVRIHRQPHYPNDGHVKYAEYLAQGLTRDRAGFTYSVKEEPNVIHVSIQPA